MTDSDVDYQTFDRPTSALARKGTGTLRKLGMIALFGGGAAVIAWLVWKDHADKAVDLLAHDKNEQFSVPQAPMPTFEEKAAKSADRSDLVKIQPAPPAAPAVDPNLEAAARQRALEEQRRLEADRAARAAADAAAKAEAERLAKEEQARQERIRSPLVVIDKDNAEAKTASAAASGAVTVKQDQESDANRAFLDRASNRDVEVARAGRLARTDALVAQGTLIHGTLDVAIQSDLPGMVRATTTQDVWSLDGRRILIPHGSRLIGEYKSGLSRGQTRVFIVWTRMIDAENRVSVQLGSIGTDDLGRTGMTGEIDRHYVERFGSAILLSIVGGGAQFIAGIGSRSQSSTSTQVYDPTTGSYTTVTTQPDQSAQQARQIASQQVSQTMTGMANEALKDSINIAPTIHVDQGERIEIFVRRDLDFSAVYTDPVKLETARLRRGGAVRRDVDPTPLPLAPPLVVKD